MTAKAQTKKRQLDVNQLAKSVVEEATDDAPPVRAPEQPEPTKDAAAVSLGRRGGLRGGKARAEALTPEQRKEIARKAAFSRWKRDG